MSIICHLKIPGPPEAEECYELFLQGKGKEIYKTSDIGDIKSVTVKHPKTDSNLWKPIEQSNIITQELETVKKKHFWHKSVTMEHPKNCYETTQSFCSRTRKRKVYTESKSADCMLQLDIIKRLMLSRCSNVMKLKTKPNIYH